MRPDSGPFFCVLTIEFTRFKLSKVSEKISHRPSQKLYEDLVRRERAASQNKSQAQEEEERIQKKLHLEIAEIRAKHATAKRAFTAAEAEAVFYNWIFSYK